MSSSVSVTIRSQCTKTVRVFYGDKPKYGSGTTSSVSSNSVSSHTFRAGDQMWIVDDQDNGIGNLLTSLLTFPQPYHLPIFGVVTRRGGLGEYNSMIHTISERAEALLDAAGVRWFQLDSRVPIEDWAPTIQRGYELTTTTHRPVFVLVNLMGG